MSKSVILVVDDDVDILSTVQMLLEDEGYEVKTATDGLQALELLRGGLRPGLILLDIMMPNLNGYQFREEQGKDPAIANIPVIIVTADGTVRRKSPDLEGFLAKPIRLDDLLKVVRRYV